MLAILAIAFVYVCFKGLIRANQAAVYRYTIRDESGKISYRAKTQNEVDIYLSKHDKSDQWLWINGNKRGLKDKDGRIYVKVGYCQKRKKGNLVDQFWRNI